MKLKTLNINLISLDKSFSEVDEAINGGKSAIDEKEELNFDSLKTFQKCMSQNRLQILMAISRLKPESVYQLEKILGRQYPHVLKDCRMLENLGFIKLVESEGAKKQLRPELIFDYDIIKVNSDLVEVFNISERSNRILLEANAC